MAARGLHKLTLALVACLTSGTVSAQSLFDRPLQKLIDCRTAGGPASGQYEFEMRTFPEGGLLAGFEVGVLKRLSFGLSFGGTRVISAENPVWNPEPGMFAAIRIINEGMFFPALGVGFDSQGGGRYDRSLLRYQYKAKGLYVVISKNFEAILGEISFHLGANKNTMEPSPRKVDVFAAGDYRPFDFIAIIAEYSPALDDRNDPQALGLNRGYLNGAVRWNIGERIAVDFIMRDLLINQLSDVRKGAGAGREVRITYTERLCK